MSTRHSHAQVSTVHTIGLVAIVVLVGALMGLMSPHAPAFSSEMAFTDSTIHGLRIVPASGGSAPITCTPVTSCGVTTHADCSVTGEFDPLEPGCSPTLPTECLPTSHCGISVGIDCAVSGTYNPALPGCSAVPSGCGAGTLNDTCLDDDDGDGDDDTCPVGYVLSGNTCVFDQCPSGWERIGNSCVLNQCPYGYVPQGGQCVAGCSAQYFYCGSGENAGTLFQRRYTPAPACVAQDLVYARCDHGCNLMRGACNPTPESDASITGKPQLVNSGDTTIIKWQATAMKGCVVTGNNGDKWSCSGAACANREEESSAITARTTYMLSCAPNDDSDVIVKSTTVNIVPVFIEQ